MQERADKLDAKMKMQTGTSGTRIELRVPGRVAFAEKRAGILLRLRSLFGRKENL
jgi:hypothetical protein